MNWPECPYCHKQWPTHTDGRFAMHNPPQSRLVCLGSNRTVEECNQQIDAVRNDDPTAAFLRRFPNLQAIADSHRRLSEIAQNEESDR